MYIASPVREATVVSIDENNTITPAYTLVRGQEVYALTLDQKKIGKTGYTRLLAGEREDIFVADSLLKSNREECVLEKELWCRTPASILGDTLSSRISGQAMKAERLAVIGHTPLREDGTCLRYLVKGSNGEGYVYSKYLVSTREDASKRYMPEKYDATASRVKNTFGGGEAIGCDFYPREKPQFENNRMPEACYSLYLNISPAVIGNIEEYIALAKRTNINCFVIDIKDNECPGYKAQAMEKYSPSNFQHAGSTKAAMYEKAVRRIQEEGFWAVGRITCFKDSYFVKDHPEVAITEKATGRPFFHNKAYWPSAYDRSVWQFNVELAKEAIRRFHFNEINFDYVRFPDRMNSVENRIDYHNRYSESKVQAIQRFVQYAADEIHNEGAYISIDVFGESANPGYTTAYGQYWPAISLVADVISGMPYPDHFANGYYGINKPWNHPYELMRAWGSRVMDRQSETPSPARVRTWIQAYHVMRHVDANGIDYNAANIEKEIRGLYDAGLTDGYITWQASSNIEKYRSQAGAFKPDYLKEHKQKLHGQSAE